MSYDNSVIIQVNLKNNFVISVIFQYYSMINQGYLKFYLKNPLVKHITKTLNVLKILKLKS